MRKFILLAIPVAALVLAGGCAGGPATPGYSGTERNQLIARNLDYDGKQMIDDFDDALLLRPASGMTIWAVQ